jgi:hypothetical protein
MPIHYLMSASVVFLFCLPTAGMAKTVPAPRQQSFLQAMETCRKNSGGATTVLVIKSKGGWICTSSMAGMDGGK